MKQTVLVIILCMLITNLNGQNKYASISGYSFGARSLSVKSLNDALKTEGLAEVKPIAVAADWVGTFWSENFVFNVKINYFASRNKEDINLTTLWCWGASYDFGFPVWKNEKMSLYPYFNLAYMVSQLKTQQITDAKSFGAVYNQSLVERSFINNGELDAALGLAYRIRVFGNHLLEVGGRYHLPLITSKKWRYIDNKVDFPKIDCRGWAIGITWVTNLRTKKATTE